MVKYSNCWFLVSILYLLVFVCGKEDESQGRSVSSASRKFYPEVEPVKTIQSEHGEVIDCVDIYSQPSLAHPLLKNHKVQLKPSGLPELLDRRNSSIDQRFQSSRQTHSGGCPKGSVPILRARSKKHGTSTAVSHPSPFGRHQFRVNSRSEKTKRFSIDEKYEVAVVEGTIGKEETLTGAAGKFSIWNPQVEGDDELSLARIQVVGASDGVHPDEEVSAGWMVSTKYFENNGTKLFARFHSVDNGGCYNMLTDCKGFVQIPSSRTLGQYLLTSDPGSLIRYIWVKIFMANGGWWLEVDGERLGYWPLELFKLKGLGSSAYATNIGGEVWNSWPGGLHTRTQMGSGKFPPLLNGNPKRVACFKSWQYIDGEGREKSLWAWNKELFVTRKNCYSATLLGSIQNEFCYGGPGYNSKCRVKKT